MHCKHDVVRPRGLGLGCNTPSEEDGAGSTALRSPVRKPEQRVASLLPVSGVLTVPTKNYTPSGSSTEKSVWNETFLFSKATNDKLHLHSESVPQLTVPHSSHMIVLVSSPPKMRSTKLGADVFFS